MSPVDSLDLLAQYAVVILPALVVAEQIGLPLPAVPALLGVGALAAQGRVSVALVMGAMVLVALCADLCWYELGRRRGASVLSKICQFTMEPDTCVRKAGTVFTRHGARGMLVAKFVPGLTTVMPPLAGIFAVGRTRFVIYDVAGVCLWGFTWIGLGYWFSDAISTVVGHVENVGHIVAVVVIAGLGGYVLVKYVRRRLFLRKVRMARISPVILKAKLDAGEAVTIIDLRTPLDVAVTPRAIPGSRWIPVDTLSEHAAELARAGDLVLYCA